MTLGRWLLILFTLLIALILDMLPMPGWGIWLRPEWLLLVLIYWIMVVPYRISVGTAFFWGLFSDLANGSLLGEQAFAFVIIAYIVAKFHKRLWLFPMQQKIVVIFGIILFYKLIIYGVQGFLGQPPETSLYWASSVVDIILWPWIFLLLNEWQKRFHIGIV